MAKFESTNKDPLPTPEANSGLQHSENLLKRLNNQNKEKMNSGKESIADVLARLRKVNNFESPKKTQEPSTESTQEVAAEQPKNNLEKTIARLEQMSLKAQSEGVVMPEARTLLSQVKRLARGVENGTLNVDALSKLVRDYDGAPINPLDKPVRFLRGIAKIAKKVGISEVGSSAYPTRDLIVKIYEAATGISNGSLTAEETLGLEDYLNMNPVVANSMSAVAKN